MKGVNISIVVILIIELLATVNGLGIPHEDCPIDEDPYYPTHLPVPGDCTKFYKCEGGLAHILDCPTGLHWSIKHDRCDYPGLAEPKCNTTNINFIKKFLVNDLPVRHPNCPLNDDPQNPTHLTYPFDCSKFYKCLSGWAYIMSCPAGLHWNDKGKICDWPHLANCTQKKNKIPRTPIMLIDNDDQPIKHKDCPTHDDPDKAKHLPHRNCTKFYKCSHGLAYPMDCPLGEHFGVEIDRCDWPVIAKCDPNAGTTTSSEPSSTASTTEEPASSTDAPSTTKSPITTTDNPTTEPVPPGIDCSNVPHGTLYPHPDSCSKFVHCDYGIGKVKYCPNDLHFSPTLLVCQWAEIAGCKVNNY